MAEKYKGYRTPKALTAYAVRLYFPYKLSLRDVGELLIERGLIVTYESIRLWVKKPWSCVCSSHAKEEGFDF